MSVTGTVTDRSWDDEILRPRGTTMVVVLRRSSTPCQAFATMVKGILHAPAVNVRLLCLDIEDSPLTARRYDISVLPTVLVFRDGVLRNRLVGTRSAERLWHEVAPHIL